ncbi:hypothetical protein ACJX0J_024766, partial [Zea mays]
NDGTGMRKNINYAPNDGGGFMKEGVHIHGADNKFFWQRIFIAGSWEIYHLRQI